MIQSQIVVRSRKTRRPPFTITGTLPFPGSPLAITPRVHWAQGEWRVDDTEWAITHVPTGLNLGAFVWDSPNAALAVLLQCDPMFPAWPLATGASDDVATKACYAKFRACPGLADK